MCDVKDATLNNLRGIVAKKMIENNVSAVSQLFKGVEYDVRLSELGDIYNPRLLQSVATTLRKAESGDPAAASSLRYSRKRTKKSLSQTEEDSTEISYGQGYHPTQKSTPGTYDTSAIKTELLKYIRKDEVIVRRSKLDWAKVVLRLHTDVPRLFVPTKRTRKVTSTKPIVIIDNVDSYYNDNAHFLQTCAKACSELDIEYYCIYKLAGEVLYQSGNGNHATLLDVIKDNPSSTIIFFGDMCYMFDVWKTYDQENTFIDALFAYSITAKFYVRFGQGNNCGCSTIPLLEKVSIPHSEVFYSWDVNKCTL